ncbi:3-oxoacyl-[acyl-carrier-protein] synthase, mitochondrial isoform X2 [Lampetra fluviatilis]
MSPSPFLHLRACRSLLKLPAASLTSTSSPPARPGTSAAPLPSPPRRRVVITGLGLICPLGVGTDAVWRRLLRGDTATVALDHAAFASLPSRVAGLVPRGTGGGDSATFDPSLFVPASQARHLSPTTVMALAAARLALDDSGWRPRGPEERLRAGVAVGVGVADLEEIVNAGVSLRELGARKLSPFFVPRILTNMPGAHISIAHGLKGPVHSVSTACATGAHALGDAARLVARGDADVMVAGGAEAAVTPLAVAGFCRARSLSTAFNGRPGAASRPFHPERDGFVIAEGAAVVVLEEMERAMGRGARILAEVMGYGMSGDANHITAPSEDGDGAYRWVHGGRPARRRPQPRRRRLRQRSRHVHSARRRGRALRHPAPLRVSLLLLLWRRSGPRHLIDEGRHRSPARRGRRARGGLRGPGVRARRAAAHRQPGPHGAGLHPQPRAAALPAVAAR